MKKDKTIALSLMIVSAILISMSCYIMTVSEEKDEFVLSIFAITLSIYLGVISTLDYENIVKKSEDN